MAGAAMAAAASLSAGGAHWVMNPAGSHVSRAAHHGAGVAGSRTSVYHDVAAAAAEAHRQRAKELELHRAEEDGLLERLRQNKHVPGQVDRINDQLHELRLRYEQQRVLAAHGRSGPDHGLSASLAHLQRATGADTLAEVATLTAEAAAETLQGSTRLTDAQAELYYATLHPAVPHTTGSRSAAHSPLRAGRTGGAGAMPHTHSASGGSQHVLHTAARSSPAASAHRSPAKTGAVAHAQGGHTTSPFRLSPQHVDAYIEHHDDVDGYDEDDEYGGRDHAAAGAQPHVAVWAQYAHRGRSATEPAHQLATHLSAPAISDAPPQPLAQQPLHAAGWPTHVHMPVHPHLLNQQPHPSRALPMRPPSTRRLGGPHAGPGPALPHVHSSMFAAPAPLGSGGLSAPTGGAAVGAGASASLRGTGLGQGLGSTQHRGRAATDFSAYAGPHAASRLQFAYASTLAAASTLGAEYRAGHPHDEHADRGDSDSDTDGDVDGATAGEDAREGLKGPMTPSQLRLYTRTLGATASMPALVLAQAAADAAKREMRLRRKRGARSRSRAEAGSAASPAGSNDDKKRHGQQLDAVVAAPAPSTAVAMPKRHLPVSGLAMDRYAALSFHGTPPASPVISPAAPQLQPPQPPKQQKPRPSTEKQVAASGSPARAAGAVLPPASPLHILRALQGDSAPASALPTPAGSAEGSRAGSPAPIPAFLASKSPSAAGSRAGSPALRSAAVSAGLAAGFGGDNFSVGLVSIASAAPAATGRPTPPSSGAPSSGGLGRPSPSPLTGAPAAMPASRAVSAASALRPLSSPPSPAAGGAANPLARLGPQAGGGPGAAATANVSVSSPIHLLAMLGQGGGTAGVAGGGGTISNLAANAAAQRTQMAALLDAKFKELAGGLAGGADDDDDDL